MQPFNKSNNKESWGEKYIVCEDFVSYYEKNE